MAVCDLHLHSTASDGVHAPAEVMRMAHEAGFTTAALTDHDSVEGIDAAREAALALGMHFIPGIELSCGADKEIHVLGYGFDPANEALCRFCREKHEERVERTKKMTAQLAEHGAPISLDRVFAIARGVPGRAHVARVLVEAGYAGSVKEAFHHYLEQGRCGFVPKREVTVAEAAALLASAGGIAVLAHPMQLKMSMPLLESAVQEWRGQGLAGIEVYHPSADAGDIPRLLSIAERNGLLVTGGSDFHGLAVKADVPIGKGLERWRTAEEDLARLVNRLSR